VVLPLQNGVEASDDLAAILGKEHVLGGTAKLISFLVAPGHVMGAETLEIGELDGAKTARLAALAETLASAKSVTVVTSSDVRAAIWSKFLFLSPWAGVGAVCRAPIGTIRSVPETRRMLQGCMEEIAAVAAMHQIRLPAGIVAATLAYMDTLPLPGRRRCSEISRMDCVRSWTASMVPSCGSELDSRSRRR
jgi:2-dehydropantoate 2-reductase